MNENELINQLKQLKDIKPDVNWAALLKSKILAQAKTSSQFKPAASGELNHSQAVPALSFNWNLKYSIVSAALGLVVLMSGTVVLAQKASPTSALYPVKRLTQNIVLVFASDDEKPKLQLSFAQEKINSLSKIASLSQRAKLSKEITSDLSSAASSVKSINKPSKILAISKDLEEQTKILKESVVINDPEVSQSIEAANHDILTIIDSTKELADKCPIEASAQLETLKNSVMSANLYPDQLTQANGLLIEAQKDLDNNVCLDALDKIKEINELLDINSTQPNNK